MNYKKGLVFIFVFSLVISSAFLFAWEFIYESFCGFGVNVSRSCIEIFDVTLESLFWSLIPLVIISPALYFSRKEAFDAWKKFAIWAFPLMLAIMIYDLTSSSPGGVGVITGGDIFQGISLIPLSIIFFLVSLVIIWRKSRHSPKN